MSILTKIKHKILYDKTLKHETFKQKVEFRKTDIHYFDLHNLSKFLKKTFLLKRKRILFMKSFLLKILFPAGYNLIMHFFSTRKKEALQAGNFKTPHFQHFMKRDRVNNKHV